MTVYHTSAEALAALEARIAGLDWQNSQADRELIKQAIHDVVSKTSVHAEGSIAALCSGKVLRIFKPSDLTRVQIVLEYSAA